jgi:hypothetical protein
MKLPHAQTSHQETQVIDYRDTLEKRKPNPDTQTPPLTNPAMSSHVRTPNGLSLDPAGSNKLMPCVKRE